MKRIVKIECDSSSNKELFEKFDELVLRVRKYWESNSNKYACGRYRFKMLGLAGVVIITDAPTIINQEQSTNLETGHALPLQMQKHDVSKLSTSARLSNHGVEADKSAKSNVQESTQNGAKTLQATSIKKRKNYLSKLSTSAKLSNHGVEDDKSGESNVQESPQNGAKTLQATSLQKKNNLSIDIHCHSPPYSIIK